MERSFEFVTRFYRHGIFQPQRKFVKESRWRGLAVAASITGAVIVAAACVLIYVNRPEATPVSTTHESASMVEVPPEKVVKRIEFDDAPLTQVVKAIEDTYGVEISGLEDTDSNLTLTLSYEGNAIDLINTINELLNTNLKVRTQSPSDK